MFENIVFIVLAIGAMVIGIYLLFLPAIIADRKGSSFWGFFLISLFTWPIALIWAWLILEDKRQHQ
jgi:uncharacterized sodium:solute symporter family permease YidK